jgi:NAD(P)-dependent dehydrogenase (short-subunit alcohol dehydrogenase family)
VTAELDLTAVLRPGLLEGVSILVAGVSSSGGSAPAELTGVALTVGDVCTKLGATVHTCDLLAGGAPEQDDALVEQAVAAALDGDGGVQVLVVDAAALFLAEPGPTAQRDTGVAQASGLIDALEASWRVTRAVANAAFIADDDGGGRIVYLAPPTAGEHSVGAQAYAHADATRAGLENLARTLSIEWARYGITPVSIACGQSTSPEQLGGTVAYLASPAGAYFSGCQLDLRGASAR